MCRSCVNKGSGFPFCCVAYKKECREQHSKDWILHAENRSKEEDQTANKLSKQHRKELKRLKAEQWEEFLIKGSEDD
ncbi:hypothetical protein KR067_010933 [Drosophila pandora]|nr:hypothetical protein KR067_010933 [Drosophila pandora]